MDPYIVTRSGIRFDLRNPRPEMIALRDIAYALARTVRFGGHGQEPYNVAQHSVLVSLLAAGDGGQDTVLTPVQCALGLEGLLHDAHEAYVGDVVAPLKVLLPDYRALELRYEAVVRARFGVPEELGPEVVEADRDACALEFSELFPTSPMYEVFGHPVIPVAAPRSMRYAQRGGGGLDVWSHDQSEAAFIRRFYELTRPAGRGI